MVCGLAVAPLARRSSEPSLRSPSTQPSRGASALSWRTRHETGRNTLDEDVPATVRHLLQLIALIFIDILVLDRVGE